MPEKIIESVNWTAGIGEYVKEGLEFDNHGGIIIPPPTKFNEQERFEVIPVTVTTRYGSATGDVKVKVSAQPSVKEVRDVTPKNSYLPVFSVVTSKVSSFNASRSFTQMEYKVSCTPKGGTWSIIGRNFMVAFVKTLASIPKAKVFPVTDVLVYLRQVVEANKQAIETNQYTENYMYLSTTISSVTEDEDSSVATIRILKTLDKPGTGVGIVSNKPVGYYEPTICYSFAGNVITYTLQAPYLVYCNSLSPSSRKNLVNKQHTGVTSEKLNGVIKGVINSKQITQSSTVYLRLGPVMYDTPQPTVDDYLKTLSFHTDPKLGW